MIITYTPIKQYIDDLREAGYPDSEIGKEIGLSRVSVWRLRNGDKKHQTTDHKVWIRLANMHTRVFQNRAKRSRRKRTA